MVKNGIYNLVAALIRIGLSLATVPLLVRLVGIDEYGLWTLASAVVAIVMLAEAGLSVSTTIFVSRDLASSDPDALSQTLTISTGGSLALATLAAATLWILAPLIVILFPSLTPSQSAAAVQAFQVGALVVWSRLLQQVAIGVEQAHQQYGVMNLLNTGQAILVSLGIIVVAWQGGRSVAMMWWQFLVGTIMLAGHIYFTWTLVRSRNIRPLLNYRKAREVARYSGLTWLTAIGGVIFTQVDKLVVGAILGTTALGVYAAITSVTIYINVLSSLPVQPLMPEIAGLYDRANQELEPILQKVKLATEINGFAALGLTAFLVTAAPFVTQFLGIQQLGIDSILMLRIAALIYGIYSLNAVGYFVLFGVNAVAVNLVFALLGGGFALLLIAVGSMTIGPVGAALGNAGYILTLGLNVLAMRKLGLDSGRWVIWLGFPLVWFVTVVTVNLQIQAIEHQLVWFITIFGFEAAILCMWFLYTAGFNLEIWKKRYASRS